MLIQSYGYVWKLSKKNYERFLKDMIKVYEEGEEHNYSEYGRLVDKNIINVTDMTADDARYELAQLKPTKTRRTK